MTMLENALGITLFFCPLYTKGVSRLRFLRDPLHALPNAPNIIIRFTICYVRQLRFRWTTHMRE